MADSTHHLGGGGPSLLAPRDVLPPEEAEPKARPVHANRLGGRAENVLLERSLVRRQLAPEKVRARPRAQQRRQVRADVVAARRGTGLTGFEDLAAIPPTPHPQPVALDGVVAQPQEFRQPPAGDQQQLGHQPHVGSRDPAGGGRAAVQRGLQAPQLLLGQQVLLPHRQQPAELDPAQRVLLRVHPPLPRALKQRAQQILEVQFGGRGQLLLQQPALEEERRQLGQPHGRQIGDMVAEMVLVCLPGGFGDQGQLGLPVLLEQLVEGDLLLDHASAVDVGHGRLLRADGVGLGCAGAIAQRDCLLPADDGAVSLQDGEDRADDPSRVSAGGFF